MTRRTLAVAALGLMLTACGGAQEKAFTRADRQAIEQRTQELAAAINARDLVKAGDFYGSTATFMPPNAATLHGRDSVQAYYQTILDSGTAEFTMEAKDVSGAVPATGPGLAYANGTYSIVVKTKSGAEQRDRGKFLFLLRNTGGTWRCEYGMWNSDLPRNQGGDE